MVTHSKSKHQKSTYIIFIIFKRFCATFANSLKACKVDNCVYFIFGENFIKYSPITNIPFIKFNFFACDFFYALYSLGDEGIPYVVKLADDEDPNIAFEAKKYLADAYFYDYFEDMQDAEELTVEDLRKQRKDKGFARFSLPKAKAYESFYEYIEENPDFAAEYREPLYEQSEEYYWE